VNDGAPSRRGASRDDGAFLMSRIRILIAIEHLSHRESLAEMLRVFRPEAAIIEVDPDGLEEAVIEREPDLVICSALSEIVETRVFGWAVLYPSDQNRAVLSLGGSRWQQPAVTVIHLLQFIDDGAARLAV
jgi:hypothetical protein